MSITISVTCLAYFFTLLDWSRPNWTVERVPVWQQIYCHTDRLLYKVVRGYSDTKQGSKDGGSISTQSYAKVGINFCLPEQKAQLMYAPVFLLLFAYIIIKVFMLKCLVPELMDFNQF